MRAMGLKGCRLARCFSWLRFQVDSTALPVKGSPLWNFTPFRSRNRYVVLFSTCQDSARSGLTVPCGSR